MKITHRHTIDVSSAIIYIEPIHNSVCPCRYIHINSFVSEPLNATKIGPEFLYSIYKCWENTILFVFFGTYIVGAYMFYCGHMIGNVIFSRPLSFAIRRFERVNVRPYVRPMVKYQLTYQTALSPETLQWQMVLATRH